MPVSGADRVKVAVVSTSETVPPTAGLNVKVAVVTVAGSTSSLNVAVSDEEVDTSVVPFAGMVAATVGAPAPPVPWEVVPGVGPSQAGGLAPKRARTNRSERRKWVCELTTGTP